MPTIPPQRRADPNPQKPADVTLSAAFRSALGGEAKTPHPAGDVPNGLADPRKKRLASERADRPPHAAPARNAAFSPRKGHR
jgi:hypothetical protein